MTADERLHRERGHQVSSAIVGLAVGLVWAWVAGWERVWFLVMFGSDSDPRPWSTELHFDVAAFVLVVIWWAVGLVTEFSVDRLLPARAATPPSLAARALMYATCGVWLAVGWSSLVSATSEFSRGYTGYGWRHLIAALAGVAVAAVGAPDRRRLPRAAAVCMRGSIDAVRAFRASPS